MGKNRPKLKGKGKRWRKGQSAISNPTTTKYRDMAKSRFFMENLGDTGLTQQAVLKHEAMTTYSHNANKSKPESDTEGTIAKELENMSVRSDNEESGSQCSGSTTRSGTSKTFHTFASNWSVGTNMTFSRLLTKFDKNNALHGDMVNVISGLNVVIKDTGAKESPNTYFLALIRDLPGMVDGRFFVPTVSLLAMGIKSVPTATLRTQFSLAATVLMEVLEKHSQSENGTLLRSLIGCLSVLLRAQAYETWSHSSTVKVFDAILAFTLHSKPKVRKAAQHAVTAVLRGSHFMIPGNLLNNKVINVHPASDHVAEFCLSQINAESLLSGHKSVLHTLNMLRDVLPLFNKKKIKDVCESLLSLMTHNNVYIKRSCLHALYALLAASGGDNDGDHNGGNLPASLAMQLARALLAARPPSSDSAQVLAWTAVMQQAYICLARLDLSMCVPNMAQFVNVCVSELWQSDIADVNAAATNALKAVLLDCLKPAIESDEFDNYKPHIESVFKMIGTGLDNPFNQAIKHVILTMAVCFEVGQENVAYILGPLLKKLNDRRESHNFHHHKEAEYATGCAVKALGPEFVLDNIPLTDGPESFNLDRSWLLAVLKEKIVGSNLKYFATHILEMATFCRKKSRELEAQNDKTGSHTYDLLCNQLWALLPSFCNSPKDIKTSFKAVARVLGNVLKDNSEFRLSVMQALRKLIACSADNDEDREELGRFAKNYLPILLNIYMSPAKGSTAQGQKLAALETIQVYLTICDNTLREELFKTGLQQLETSQDNHVQKEAILDVIRLLVLYQNSDQISVLFDKWVLPLCETVLENPKQFKKARKEQRTEKMEEEQTEDSQKVELNYKQKAKLLEMEHKKAYRILEEIFKSENDSCKEFLKRERKKIRKLLMASLNKLADSSKTARLRCIEHLIKQSQSVSAENKLLRSAMTEAVICTRDINSKCRQCAFNLIATVGGLLQAQEGGMQEFLSMLLPGLEASVPRIVSASLRALASALFNFFEDMGLETVQSLLDTVAQKMLDNNREIVAAAMSFLKVYTKVMPTEVLAGSLPVIIKTLSSMTDDCKRHARLEIGYFLTRLVRKYGADTITKLIPSNDEVMLKRLRNIRKLENRKSRQRESRRDQNDSDSDLDIPTKGTSKTLEEILKDSDSDMEYMDEEDHRPKTKSKKGKNQTWIQDDPENILDLADISAARKITATDPNKNRKTAEVQAQKKTDGGFKTAPDGRLIIADDDFDYGDGNEEPRPSGDVDSNTDDTDDEDTGKPSKLLKAGTKRRYDDILSVKSGRSNRSKASTATLRSKYKAGGKGIHRPLGSAASVASTAGTEYRSRKAHGDVKKQGKHDPYAYLPMSRKNLNKRKKAMTSQQFKGVVKSKARMRNKSKRK